MSLEHSAGTADLVDFRRILPGLNIHDLGRKLRQLAMVEAKMRRDNGERPPHIPTAESLRSTVLYANPDNASKELRDMLRPILDQMKVDLSEDPAYLNGKVPVDLFNADALRTALREMGVWPVRGIFNSRLGFQIKSSRANQKGSGFAHIPAEEFRKICTKLNALIKDLDLDQHVTPADRP